MLLRPVSDFKDAVIVERAIRPPHCVISDSPNVSSSLKLIWPPFAAFLPGQNSTSLPPPQSVAFSGSQKTSKDGLQSSGFHPVEPGRDYPGIVKNSVHITVSVFLQVVMLGCSSSPCFIHHQCKLKNSRSQIGCYNQFLRQPGTKICNVHFSPSFFFHPNARIE